MENHQGKLRPFSKLESKNLAEFSKKKRAERVYQNFHEGDLVCITDKMPRWMSHFHCGQYAIILGSYHDQYGSDHGKPRKRDTQIYSLYLLKEGCSSSWYEEDQLTLIERGGG